ncbi:unnamed protein product, partial [Prorocentrum cordatum]
WATGRGRDGMTKGFRGCCSRDKAVARELKEVLSTMESMSEKIITNVDETVPPVLALTNGAEDQEQPLGPARHVPACRNRPVGWPRDGETGSGSFVDMQLRVPEDPPMRQRLQKARSRSSSTPARPSACTSRAKVTSWA